MWVHTYTYECACVCVYVCVYVCVCVVCRLWGSACRLLQTRVKIFKCIYTYTYVCACMRVYVCVCLCLCVYVLCAGCGVLLVGCFRHFIQLHPRHQGGIALQSVAVYCCVLQCVSNTPSISIRIGNACMCCGVLQCVAVCYSVLQCIVVCWSVFLTPSPNPSAPSRYVSVAVCCSVLQCVTVCCSVLQCVAVCAVSKYASISAQFARLFSQYVSSFFKATTCKLQVQVIHI